MYCIYLLAEIPASRLNQNENTHNFSYILFVILGLFGGTGVTAPGGAWGYFSGAWVVGIEPRPPAGKSYT